MAPRIYQVAIGQRTLSVALRRDGDVVFARVGDGIEQPVRLHGLEGPLHALQIGDVRTELLAERTADGARVALEGLQYEARVLDEARARLARVVGGGQASHGQRELKAPMPGLVVKVLVEAGAEAASGQPLVVLQAMKMENELSLPDAGTVQSVRVAAGQTVDQGELLVVLE